MINIKNIPKKYRTCINCKHCKEERIDYDYEEYYCWKHSYHTDENDTCNDWEFNGYQLAHEYNVLWHK